MADITAALLPTSRVDFYVLDDGTEATARKLSDDWRFARVDVQITRAGIDHAINTYGQYASPELIIIETDDISDAFIEKLGGLAGVCAQGTDAVIIGPMNDVHLYRSLVGMGVRDYLVRPVGEKDLLHIIARVLVDKRGTAGARLVAVVGSKGGVGTTSVAQALASIMAEQLKQKTLLMDAAGSSGSLGIAFGAEPATNFAEAVRIGSEGTEDDMKRIIQPATEQLSLLVCGGEAMLSDRPDPDGVEALVTRIMQKYPVVVMDLSGSSVPIQKRILALAGHVVVVSTAQLPALRNCRTLLNELRHMRNGTEGTELVINMQGVAGSDEVPLRELKNALDREHSAVIAHLPKIFAGSEAAGKGALSIKGGDDVFKQLADIASRACGATAKEEGGDDGKSGGPFAFLKNIGKATSK
ncbi:MAG: AAA family ATPase [Alphaproteobacteria bacterium]|nr:AAA family ATPase [Alphaproteobacteria bacterium]